MFLVIPITLAFHSAANTDCYIGEGDRDRGTKQPQSQTKQRAISITNPSNAGTTGIPGGHRHNASKHTPRHLATSVAPPARAHWGALRGPGEGCFLGNAAHSESTKARRAPLRMRHKAGRGRRSQSSAGVHTHYINARDPGVRGLFVLLLCALCLVWRGEGATDRTIFSAAKLR